MAKKMLVNEILEELEKIDKQSKKLSEQRSKLIKKLSVANSEDWDWITVKNCAERMHLSVSTIYERINSGTIKFKKIGAKIYVSWNELKEINDAEICWS